MLQDFDNMEKGKMQLDGFHKAERDRQLGAWQIYNELSTTLALRSRFTPQEKQHGMKKHGPFDRTKANDQKRMDEGWNRAIDKEIQRIAVEGDHEFV